MDEGLRRPGKFGFGCQSPRASKPKSHLPFGSEHRLQVSPGALLVLHVHVPAKSHPRMKELCSYAGYPHDRPFPFYFPIITSGECKTAVHLECLHTNVMPARAAVSGLFLRVVMAMGKGGDQGFSKSRAPKGGLHCSWVFLTRGCHCPQEHRCCNGQRRWGGRKALFLSSFGRWRAEKHKMTKGFSDTKVHEARRHLYSSPFQSWISTSCIAATYWRALSWNMENSVVL